jgi:class 3 adenylate cyclase
MLLANPAWAVRCRAAVRRHHELLRGAVEAAGGVVFETVGDAVCAAFARPTDAVAAALAGQLALGREAWGATGPLRARMDVHLGEVERQGGHYFGAPLYRCARLTATAHGGQTVLSEAAPARARGGSGAPRGRGPPRRGRRGGAARHGMSLGGAPSRQPPVLGSPVSRGPGGRRRAVAGPAGRRAHRPRRWAPSVLCRPRAGG